ncbi:hypothetical protein ASG53_02765 [Sanguibacter sp. Leaf3]|nr:hypothetical protein ASG53_02765 [Sanguibacter sp. Leaf3]
MLLLVVVAVFGVERDGARSRGPALAELPRPDRHRQSERRPTEALTAQGPTGPCVKTCCSAGPTVNLPVVSRGSRSADE